LTPPPGLAGKLNLRRNALYERETFQHTRSFTSAGGASTSSMVRYLQGSAREGGIAGGSSVRRRHSRTQGNLVHRQSRHSMSAKVTAPLLSRRLRQSPDMGSLLSPMLDASQSSTFEGAPPPPTPHTVSSVARMQQPPPPPRRMGSQPTQRPSPALRVRRGTGLPESVRETSPDRASGSTFSTDDEDVSVVADGERRAPATRAEGKENEGIWVPRRYRSDDDLDDDDNNAVVVLARGSRSISPLPGASPPGGPSGASPGRPPHTFRMAQVVRAS
jgi:hypothetical protein